MQQLAHAIVRDGEGATKFISVEVEGGIDVQECLQVAYAIAHSPLTKTAMFASDPNWGRILSAVGYSGVTNLDVNKLKIHLGNVLLVEEGGCAKTYTEAAGQGGKWEFPGGKIEVGETHQQALARELKEEVNLELNPNATELFQEVHHDYSDKQVSLYFYLAKQAIGTAVGLEGQPVLWVDAKAMAQLVIPDANQSIADALLKNWPTS